MLQVGEHTVELARGATHYELAGPQEGRLVVLLHGGTVPLWTWDRVWPHLVGAGLRVLRYDLYGRGRSAAPRVRYDRALYLGQLEEMLDAAAAGERVDLVGFSFGGGLAASFATAHPERVGRVALLSPIVHYDRDNRLVSLMRTPVVGELLMRFVAPRRLAARVGAMWRGPERERYAPPFVEQVTSGWFARAMLSMMRSDALGDYRDVYRRLGATDHPVLLVWGDADEEIPRADVERVRELVPRLELAVVAGVGHGLVFAAAEEVAERLIAFLAPGSAS